MTQTEVPAYVIVMPIEGGVKFCTRFMGDADLHRWEDWMGSRPDLCRLWLAAYDSWKRDRDREREHA